MDFEEAKERLQFHGCTHPDSDDPKWEKGFLGSLRPYSSQEGERWQEERFATLFGGIL